MKNKQKIPTESKRAIWIGPDNKAKLIVNGKVKGTHHLHYGVTGWLYIIQPAGKWIKKWFVPDGVPIGGTFNCTRNPEFLHVPMHQ